jgi:hypothetical protein
MLSYHNDPSLKSLVVQEMKKHQAQDQFIKGSYGEVNGKFKGCAVGCTIDSVNVILGKSYDTSSHDVLEGAIGIPEWLSILQDSFFENLPVGENSQFAVDFLDAIPVGVNLEPVKWKFCAFLMREGIERVLGLKDISEELREQVLSAMRGVLALNESAITTGQWDLEAARAARSAAWAARSASWDAEAWSALRTAHAAVDAVAVAWSSAAAAVRAAVAWSAVAWSSAAVAWSSAAAARSSAAEWSASEAEAEAYKRYAAELISLLKE